MTNTWHPSYQTAFQIPTDMCVSPQFCSLLSWLWPQRLLRTEFQAAPGTLSVWLLSWIQSALLDGCVLLSPSPMFLSQGVLTGPQFLCRDPLIIVASWLISPRYCLLFNEAFITPLTRRGIWKFPALWQLQ